MIISTFKLKEPDATLQEDDELNRQSIVTGCVRLEGIAKYCIINACCFLKLNASLWLC